MSKRENDYGEPLRYDSEFKGPIHNRSCTDIICLLLFFIFLGVWGFVGYYGITHGNVQKLLAPIDSQGRHCGLDSGVVDKKYLVFFDITRCLSPETPITGCPTPQVCVEKCPDRTIQFEDELNAATLDSLRDKIVCTYDVNKNTMTLDQARQYITDDKCTKRVLQSQPVLFRCIGDLSTMCRKDKAHMTGSRIASDESCVKNAKESQKSLLNRATAFDSYIGWIVAGWVVFFTRGDRDVHILSAEIVNDLVQSRWYLLGALVVVVVICFIYILLLRWVVAPVVWSSIVLLIALLAYGAYACYMQYKYYLVNNVNTYQTTNLKGYAQSIFAKHQTWLTLLIVLVVMIIIYLLIVIFLRKRIVIAISLIREGSKAVIDVKSTIFFPIIPWICQCAVIAYAVIVLMYLMSIGDATFQVVNYNADACDCQGNTTQNYQSCNPLLFFGSCKDKTTSQSCLATCHFTGFENPLNSIYILHVVNLLGFYWTMFFISGAADMMLASTFSTWYWTYDKKQVPFFTLTTGIYRTLRFHLGTVAFGSLIIAIIRVIRVILEYIDHKLKKFDNPLSRCFLCCCKCFFWCLEKFMKFINKNAYIMCAVHGKNFCRSAYDAFSLIMRNIVRVVVLDKVADLIFFMSKLLISLGVGFAVYHLLQLKFVYEVTKGAPLNHNYVPAVILTIATYLICSIFFNVYSMAVDTLFLCFLEDCERNDGSPEKRYYMSKNLMKILGKKNKRE